VAFKFVSVEEAIDSPGLRMVVVGGIPSPWGEAAKGILHVKNLDWKAVRLDYDDKKLAEWAGGRTGPVLFYNGDRPRSSWTNILILAERIAPAPALIPADAAERALMFGFAHEILAEAGLCWSRRLQLIHAGLQGDGGFAPPVAQYLGKKYGYRPDSEPAATRRVVEILGALATRLRVQQAAGSGYFIGETLTALDIYSAAAMALILPMPPEHCDMHEKLRTTFEWRNDQTEAALEPILIEHRDRIYAQHLELPLSL
jgi:glutathione S-transferase